MNSTYKIKYTKGRYSVNHPYTEKVIFRVTSKKIIQDLMKLNCMPKKSLTLTFPDFLPEEYKSHFMRGYFDGDGTIYMANINSRGYTYKKYHFAIIGTKEFCEFYLKELINIGISGYAIHKEKRTKENVYHFRVSRQEDVLKIYEFFYKDATIFLERKKAKFDDFYKTLNK